MKNKITKIESIGQKAQMGTDINGGFVRNIQDPRPLPEGAHDVVNNQTFEERAQLLQDQIDAIIGSSATTTDIITTKGSTTNPDGTGLNIVIDGLETKTTMVEYGSNLSEWDGTVVKWEETKFNVKDPLVVEGAYQKDLLLQLRKIKRADGSIGFDNQIRGGLVLLNGIDDQPFTPLYDHHAATKKYVDDKVVNNFGPFTLYEDFGLSDDSQSITITGKFTDYALITINVEGMGNGFGVQNHFTIYSGSGALFNTGKAFLITPKGSNSDDGEIQVKRTGDSTLQVNRIGGPFGGIKVEGFLKLI